MIHQLINSMGSHYNGECYEGKTWDFHFHYSFELIYVLSGSIKVSINMDEIYVEQGEFVLVSPSVVHRITESEKSRFFIGIFTRDFATEFFDNELKQNVYHFRVEKAVFEFFRKYLLYPESYNRYMVKACFYAICGAAEENSIHKADSNTDYTFIFKVNRYISENFKFDISRKDIARALNYEEHYFSYLFSKNVNTNLKKYINIYRVAAAQKLLISTNLSATQIASECGFNSIRSFNDIFKEFSGKTPSEYRSKRNI